MLPDKVHIVSAINRAIVAVVFLTYDAKVMAQNVDPYFSRVEGSETKLFLRKDRAFSALSDYI